MNVTQIFSALLVFIAVSPGAQPIGDEDMNAKAIEQWDIFEVELEGPTGGNPFMDVALSAEFRNRDTVLAPEGFYDGAGIYRIRCMPTAPGEWTFTTKSNCGDLDGRTGSFRVTAATGSNHGPVRVHRTHYLRYADDTPYFQVGTTCYAWTHQGEEQEALTLKTLETAPFNKLRMCVFPKHYTYNRNKPRYYVFPRKGNRNDYTHFSPKYFHHLEQRVEQLRDLNIEADLIVFHPYDRWGYAGMPAEVDDRYIRYLVARLAAFRNVWWSMANEFDLMRKKKLSDWDRYFQLFRKHDPYDHMRGIHNCRRFYDHTKDWVTHASIQSSAMHTGIRWREQYRKPIVIDECRYEGDVPQGWGNLSPEAMAERFWLGAMAGCYVGHGETYRHPEDLLWWSKGGVLHGESPPRIAFFREIMERAPFEEMTPSVVGRGVYLLTKESEQYLLYFKTAKAGKVLLADGGDYKVEGFDTWNMTREDVGTAKPGVFGIRAPTGAYLFRFTPYASGESRLPLLTSLEVPDEPPGRSGIPGPPIKTRQVEMFIDEKAAAGSPIVVVGKSRQQNALGTLHGQIKQNSDGSLDFPESTPWKWISVGDRPMRVLDGLQSFTICGRIRASSLRTGSGGNRIAFNLNYNTSGFDLVCLADGSLRLSVNEWPDRISNDSSPGRIVKGKWVFFAVTYDGTARADNVKWYFGGENRPATLDRTNTYARGATGAGSGKLTIGNYNETLHRHGRDRQFRGTIESIAVFGSRTGADGALELDRIQTQQKDL